MNETLSVQRILPVSRGYHDSMTIYVKYFLKFFAVTLIPGVITFLLGIALKVSVVSSLTQITTLSDVIAPQHVSSLVTVLLIATMVLVQTLGVIALTYTVVNHEKVSALAAFEHGLSYFWRFVAVSVSVLLASVVGLIAGFVPIVLISSIFGAISIELLNTTFDWIVLIAPAVSSIFTTFFIFAPFILIEKNSSFRDALRQSHALVRGHFWETAFRLLIFYAVVAILLFAFSFIPNIGRALALITVTPFSVIYLYLLYNNLEQLHAKK